jgi:hypothetical protein
VFSTRGIRRIAFAFVVAGVIIVVVGLGALWSSSFDTAEAPEPVSNDRPAAPPTLPSGDEPRDEATLHVAPGVRPRNGQTVTMPGVVTWADAPRR